MHIILGFLGSVVTILWLLHRLAEMGIDLGGLNPWLWQRRRKWKQRYEGNPIYSLEDPMDVTGLLIAAVAKADGDMTSEEKKAILKLFEERFHLSKTDAAGLLVSSTYLLKDGEALRSNVDKVLAPSLDSFSTSQAESAISMLNEIAHVGGDPTEPQAQLLSEASRVLSSKNETPPEW